MPANGSTGGGRWSLAEGDDEGDDDDDDGDERSVGAGEAADESDALDGGIWTSGGSGGREAGSAKVNTPGETEDERRCSECAGDGDKGEGELAREETDSDSSGEIPAAADGVVSTASSAMEANPAGTADSDRRAREWNCADSG